MTKAKLAQGAKERPIIFSPWKLRRILEWDFERDGDMQTRRVMQPQPCDGCEDENGVYYQKFDSRIVAGIPMTFADRVRPVCPYGKVGDRLWVRETWGDVTGAFDSYDGDEPRVWAFKVDEAVHNSGGFLEHMKDSGIVCQRWRSPRFMFKWMSRLTIELTGVRYERVQDITAADCMAEGVIQDPLTVAHRQDIAIGRFAEGWDELNAKRGFSFDLNKWVWVLSFRRLTPTP